MSKKTKLELTWIGKEYRPKLEPRVLIEDPEKSYHAPRVNGVQLMADQCDARVVEQPNIARVGVILVFSSIDIFCAFFAQKFR